MLVKCAPFITLYERQKHTNFYFCDILYYSLLCFNVFFWSSFEYGNIKPSVLDTLSWKNCKDYQTALNNQVIGLPLNYSTNRALCNALKCIAHKYAYTVQHLVIMQEGILDWCHCSVIDYSAIDSVEGMHSTWLQQTLIHKQKDFQLLAMN